MKKKLFIYTLSLGVLFSSCESLIEVEPENDLSASAVFTNIEAAQSVLNSAYSRLAVSGELYGRDLKLLGDALADNIVTDASLAGQRWMQLNLNAPASHYSTSVWGTSYQVINDVNEVIDKTPGLTVTPTQEATRSSILAQAYTIRALTFFNLARIYGYEPNQIPTSGPGAGFDRSVVIRLTPTAGLSDALPIPRASILETYAQIESDLNTAIAHFANASSTNNRYFNLGTAYAIKGTLNLYWERYQQAITDFDAAFANSSAVLTTDIVGAFEAVENPEAFTQLWITWNVQSLGSNNSLYSYTHAPEWEGISTFGGQTVAPEVYDLFEADDDRLGLIFVDPRHPQYRWSNKYNGANGLYTDNPMITRYSDVLLMKAEAQAALGQYAEAAAEVVRLREARNASVDIVPANAAIVDFIQEERVRELHFEGVRFFDLKRLGLGIYKSSGVAASYLPPTDFKVLANIPNAQITLNPQLPQNPGY